MNGAGLNWLSGHWSNHHGVAYHSGWMNGHSDYGPVETNWLLVCDRPSVVWFQIDGQPQKSVTGGNNNAPSYLHINNGGETSDYELAELVVFNTKLSDADAQLNMDFYKERFGVSE